jgi:peroxiredoxin
MAEKTFAELLEEAESGRMMDAPLSERLKAVADEVNRLSPEFAGVVARMVARLETNNVGQSAPQIGERMPDFILPDEKGKLVRLENLLEQGPVVVSFHRGHWCPYCRLNADGLARIAPDVKRLGAQIVAISPETHQYGAELKSYANAPFPILADVDSGYALELNLLFWVGDEKREAMRAGGFDIAAYQGNETWMLPIPATFIVGRDGLVKARYIDPDYRRRMELDAILAGVSRLHEEAAGVPGQSAPASRTERELSKAPPAAYRRSLSS